MAKDKYRITILGDNSLTGVIDMTDEEYAFLQRLLSSLHPDGSYVPAIFIDNLSEEARRQAAEARKDAEERAKHDAEFESTQEHLGMYSIRDKVLAALADKEKRGA